MGMLPNDNNLCKVCVVQKSVVEGMVKNVKIACAACNFPLEKAALRLCTAQLI